MNLPSPEKVDGIRVVKNCQLETTSNIREVSSGMSTTQKLKNI